MACEHLATKLSRSIVWVPHSIRGKLKGLKKIVTTRENTTLNLLGEAKKLHSSLSQVKNVKKKKAEIG